MNVYPKHPSGLMNQKVAASTPEKPLGVYKKERFEGVIIRVFG